MAPNRLTPVLALRAHGPAVYAAIIALSLARFAAAAAGDAAVTYNRDVRPILSEKCFACHGFDAKKRKADLRLDTPEGATATLKSGVVALVPGDLKSSDVWRRVTTDDADDHMPPAASHKDLTAAERTVIRRWIEAGARYEKHWAFESPRRPPLPAGAIGNPIDAFIADRLKREGFAPLRRRTGKRCSAGFRSI